MGPGTQSIIAHIDVAATWHSSCSQRRSSEERTQAVGKKAERGRVAMTFWVASSKQTKHNTHTDKHRLIKHWPRRSRRFRDGNATYSSRSYQIHLTRSATIQCLHGGHKSRVNKIFLSWTTRWRSSWRFGWRRERAVTNEVIECILHPSEWGLPEKRGLQSIRKPLLLLLL